eukprot:111794-Prymnesium_polylepis.1
MSSCASRRFDGISRGPSAVNCMPVSKISKPSATCVILAVSCPAARPAARRRLVLLSHWGVQACDAP